MSILSVYTVSFWWERHRQDSGVLITLLKATKCDFPQKYGWLLSFIRRSSHDVSGCVQPRAANSKHKYLKNLGTRLLPINYLSPGSFVAVTTTILTWRLCVWASEGTRPWLIIHIPRCENRNAATPTYWVWLTWNLTHWSSSKKKRKDSWTLKICNF